MNPVKETNHATLLRPSSSADRRDGGVGGCATGEGIGQIRARADRVAEQGAPRDQFTYRGRAFRGRGETGRRASGVVSARAGAGSLADAERTAARRAVAALDQGAGAKA